MDFFLEAFLEVRFLEDFFLALRFGAALRADFFVVRRPADFFVARFFFLAANESPR